MHYKQPIWTGESHHVRITSIYLYFVPVNRCYSIFFRVSRVEKQICNEFNEVSTQYTLF